MMIEDDGDYKVSIEYGAELFEHQTVERMLAHYIELLANVVQQPEHNIGDINMATADERTLILGEFNNTRETLDNRRIFMDHFEAQVEQTPNRTAIVYEGESLTYQELNDKANQLAYKLRAEGVKPNMVVGMLTQRSLEMMIGIYGILKQAAHMYQLILTIQRIVLTIC
ncbi:putative non-ribosomal peptide synthetase [Staphylococcus gallinarum]|uniref:Putative non-ribosomal peptide synthetase n=1 Tax=Staphylococcus gallinarum TaxID=1293 RepID=A0A380FCH3_STAGA|nr:putative non-ribosomal peptide synthetase [Staphylococcus gallinarum]